MRNVCYDFGIKKSKSYELPVIAIGNLSVGGTGKTPMTEYLIRLLKADYKLAVLSRGYGRKTKDFVLADSSANAETIGDEPFQFYKKFEKAITVAVDGNRQRGIANLLNTNPQPEVILLDDAFQHRKVKAGFYILLTAYNDLYANDFILPVGNLREPRAGAKRANIVVVTKCPDNLSETEKQKISKSLNLKANQELFFSTISYSEMIYSESESQPISTLKNQEFTLVTGIANPESLINYLRNEGLNFEHLAFKDHHNFSEKELKALKQKSFILTTEKDFMRLSGKLKHDNLYYLPIQKNLKNTSAFEARIIEFIQGFRL